MPNRNYSEFPEQSSIKGGGSPPATGPKEGSEGSVSERTRNYPDPGAHQPKDRSAGVARALIYPQSKGL